MNHMEPLTRTLTAAIDDYRAENPECDVNDVLSVLALIIALKCRAFEVDRTEMLRNIGMIYEMTEPGAVN